MPGTASRFIPPKTSSSVPHDDWYPPAGASADRTVEVRVRDNGTGIPPEIRDQLFQPFFTTKPTGEGTGLGLSISWDIVTQQHGGAIEVDSQPGEFTEFTIRLPRNGQSSPHPDPPPQAGEGTGGGSRAPDRS
jgi:signal transduction histidine kinase